MAKKTGNKGLEHEFRNLHGTGMESSPVQMLEKLFDLSLDMLCVADFDGNFRLINAAFENILGYSRETLLRTPFMDLVHPDDKEKTLGAMKQLVAGERVRYFENRYRCKDGSYKWLAWTSVPVVEERFEYAVARDITQQKETERELAAQRDLFENVLSSVPASIFWKDRNSVFLGANKRFAQDAGFPSPDELVGKTDYDLAWTREQSDFYRECDRRVMENREPMLNIEESQQQPDGRKVALLTNKVPLLDSSGEVVGMLGIYMDITKLKQAEEEIQRYQRELAHVTRLGTMGEMASGLAHELNQPLTALISYCDSAISLVNAMSAPPTQLDAVLARAMEQAHRASQIIRSLREFTSKGDIQKQCLDIDEVIREVLVFLKYEAEECRAKIDFYPARQPQRVLVNKVQIGQVLINILQNSIDAIRQAERTDGRIVVQTRLLPNDSVEVTVTDNGPGIDADMFRSLFEPFKTSKANGMGIGLSLSRRIIEDHGGQLWVDRQYQDGALLGFILPVCQ